MKEIVAAYFYNLLDRLEQDADGLELSYVLRGIDLNALFEALATYKEALQEFDLARATPMAQESPYKQVSLGFANAIDRRLKAQAKLMKFAKDVMRKVRK